MQESTIITVLTISYVTVLYASILFLIDVLKPESEE